MKILLILAVLACLLIPSVLAAGLEITELDVNVDYDEAYTYRIENRDRIDSTTVALANGSKIDADILLGANVTFTARVENTFPHSGEDLSGVFLTITIEDIDDGADLDEDSLDFDLEPGNDERSEVKFSIPLDADAGTYNVVIEAEGENRNHTVFSTLFNLKLEVKKQNHDLRITKVALTPGIVDCDRNAKLSAEIMNLGSSLENEVAVEFKATSLGINSYDKDIALLSSDDASDEEKRYSKSLNVEVPDFLRSGAYPILVNLYWKNFVLFDQKTVYLDVRGCVSKPAIKPNEEEKNDTDEVIVVQPEDGQSQERNQTTDWVTATREVSILRSPLLLAAILGGLIAAAFVVIAVLGYVKGRRP